MEALDKIRIRLQKEYGEKSKDYQDCREYFFSLQKYIGNWPVKLDIEDDYLIDLEFVKSNDRRFK